MRFCCIKRILITIGSNTTGLQAFETSMPSIRHISIRSSNATFSSWLNKPSLKVFHLRISNSNSDGYTVKVSEDPQEIQKLLEVGFDFVCQKDTLIFLRKRK